MPESSVVFRWAVISAETDIGNILTKGTTDDYVHG